MNIQEGFAIDEPKVFVPWHIHEETLVFLFNGQNLEKVRSGYYTIACKTMNGLECQLGFHFEPKDNGLLQELEFLPLARMDRIDSFNHFQTYLERAFGPPTKISQFDCYWNIDDVHIDHYLSDRYGTHEEVLRIKKLNHLKAVKKVSWIKRIWKSLFLLMILILSQNMLHAQDVGGFVIEADVVGKDAHPELLRFSKKFDAWISSKQDNTLSITMKKESMINNFILFSEDGLMMKDFKFHSVASCKKEILSSLSQKQTPANEDPWIFVTLESQVNKKELIAILEFLREQGINYEFGDEDKFIPAIGKG